MNSERRLVALADDLTGALEAGAKFAAEGVAARVTCDCTAGDLPGAVMVFDTETRHASAEQAATVMSEVANRVREHAPWLVYKKTDSTLRGNIGAELGALHQVFPEREILYVPAYPAMGRTVRNGRLLVDGVPVHETEFAHDALNPVRNSEVQSCLGDVPATVVDGTSDEDVLACAREIANRHGPLIVAGPAAIAGAIAKCVPLATEAQPPAIPPLRRCLVINGSMSNVSEAQISYAVAHGCVDQQWTVFQYRGSASGVGRALHVGEQVLDHLDRAEFAAIIVFGGDTAFGILQALRRSHLDCCGEVLPGVPVSRTGSLCWITKAGGFGAPDLLCRLRKQLT